jgi:hypothetical protein
MPQSHTVLRRGLRTGSRRSGDERGGVGPGLVIAGAAVVAFVVALIAMGAGGSGGAQDVSTETQSTEAAPTNQCGDGKPDPSYTVALTSDPSPPRPEGTTFHLAVRHNGDPVTGAKVCMSADMPDMQHPGLTQTAKETPAGVYNAMVKFSMGGSWAASVTILEQGKAPVLLTTAFQVTE